MGYPSYVQIVYNIKVLIERKGMKQMAVANRAGFSAPDFSHIMHFRKLLRVEHLPRVAQALDVSIDELFVCNGGREDDSVC